MVQSEVSQTHTVVIGLGEVLLAPSQSRWQLLSPSLPSATVKAQLNAKQASPLPGHLGRWPKATPYCDDSVTVKPTFPPPSPLPELRTGVWPVFGPQHPARGWAHSGHLPELGRGGMNASSPAFSTEKAFIVSAPPCPQIAFYFLPPPRLTF